MLAQCLSGLIFLFYLIQIDDQYLLIGSEKGAVHIGTDPETRWKVLHSVISMNPLMSSAL